MNETLIGQRRYVGPTSAVGRYACYLRLSQRDIASHTKAGTIQINGIV
jgi:hypothetical protein